MHKFLQSVIPCGMAALELSMAWFCICNLIMTFNQDLSTTILKFFVVLKLTKRESNSIPKNPVSYCRNRAFVYLLLFEY
jgi:hypothetical protein